MPDVISPCIGLEKAIASAERFDLCKGYSPSSSTSSNDMSLVESSVYVPMIEVPNMNSRQVIQNLNLHKTIPKKNKIFVVDTNIFLHELPFIKRLFNTKIDDTKCFSFMIPDVVIIELYNIRDCKRKRSSNAIDAIQFLIFNLLGSEGIIFGQRSIGLISPEEFLYKCNDDVIFYVALRLTEMFGRNQVFVLTDDANLSIKCYLCSTAVLNRKLFYCCFSHGENYKEWPSVRNYVGQLVENAHNQFPVKNIALNFKTILIAMIRSELKNNNPNFLYFSDIPFESSTVRQLLFHFKKSFRQEKHLILKNHLIDAITKVQDLLMNTKARDIDVLLEIIQACMTFSTKCRNFYTRQIDHEQCTNLIYNVISDAWFPFNIPCSNQTVVQPTASKKIASKKTASKKTASKKTAYKIWRRMK